MLALTLLWRGHEMKLTEEKASLSIAKSAISNDENGCRHMCLFIRIFINNF